MRYTFPFLMALVLLSTTSFAAKISDVEFPDTVTIDNKNLVLNGLGHRERTFLKVRVYAIGLYLENKTEGKKTGEELVADTGSMKKVTMHFLRKVDAKTMREVWAESLDEQSGENKASIADAKKTFLEAFPDIRTDDKVNLIFTSTGVKMEIEQDEKPLATTTINDPKFAAVLLNVWLGKKPIDDTLRDKLIAKK